jgi:PAS domain S-box-containing protein
VSELDFGIVAKIDLTEIRAPFVKAGILAICIAFLVILLGSGIFLRIINPVIRQLEDREKELLFERNKFLGILDSMQDGVYIVEENHDIEYVNPALKQIFGAVEGRKCYEYFHDRTGACPWCKNQEVFAGNTVRWEWYSSKNQRTYDLLDTPLKKSDGKISKLEILRDVTDRKLVEEELQKARSELEQRVEERTVELKSSNEELLLEIEERKRAEEKIWKARALLRNVVDGISEPLLMLDTNLSVRMLNKAALKYYQLDAYQDAIGKPCQEVSKGESYPCDKCPVPSVISDARNATYDRKGPFDPNRLEQVTIYPLQEESGEVMGCILRITDITKEKEVERQLLLADRLSSLGQLSGGIAHEIRNPLAGINLFVDVLCDEDKFERTDNELEIFEEIKNNINRIDVIIRGILDFSKDSDAVSAEIDLNSLIEETLKLWHAKMRNQEIRLQLSLEEDLPTFFGDPIGIQQVVNNLIHNAVEAMEGGGLLQISTQKGIFSVSEGRPVVIIQVQDTGPGIAPDQQEKIFNPFFTTKRTGTGLGLSISHQIIERHGGIISCNSQPDELTTFKIELPTTPKS